MESSELLIRQVRLTSEANPQKSYSLFRGSYETHGPSIGCSTMRGDESLPVSPKQHFTWCKTGFASGVFRARSPQGVRGGVSVQLPSGSVAAKNASVLPSKDEPV